MLVIINKITVFLFLKWTMISYGDHCWCLCILWVTWISMTCLGHFQTSFILILAKAALNQICVSYFSSTILCDAVSLRNERALPFRLLNIDPLHLCKLHFLQVDHNPRETLQGCSWVKFPSIVMYLSKTQKEHLSLTSSGLRNCFEGRAYIFWGSTPDLPLSPTANPWVQQTR